ncbi:hypothetical protein NM688_g1710 [Phlebia brevispora]|uniref:Uncharacterized protein n=1 Tax=Phlebia brevispora TaxID=194682 RepID=A0ACC1TAY0_9APHY|nr:hypothetical protein NM688_g1710 [Phlebia brevispora]
MSSWLRTWLPTLPSIDFSLPTSIQKRFLSFALRQALGHLLKPGQLDTQQVDAQIGSGFVQVRDVELDNEAINSLITGLPLQLHDGSVGKVTARIPWPNPLTAAVGLSLESLHLTFNIIPTISTDFPAYSNLADSVTSAAETFIHDELDPDEEAALRDSIHPDLAASATSLDNLPGGLDPFISDEALHNDVEPSGVSIFATLVERLLSRFQFDATDIKITFVHPEHASFTISIPNIRYQTEVNRDSPSYGPSSSDGSEQRGGKVDGTTRTVSIHGVTVTTRCLRSQSPQTHPSPMLANSLTAPADSLSSPDRTTPFAQYSSPPSPALSDSSELDEETHMMMSQSLVGLPPRPVSPASSVSSSMYQSAISVASPGPSSVYAPRIPPAAPAERDESEEGRTTPTSPSPPQPVPKAASFPDLKIATDEIQDETVLSFGSEPITIRLTTPAPIRRAAEPVGPGSSNENRKDATEDPDALKLEITLGVIAVALKARHIRSILDISQLVASHAPEPRAPKTEDDAQRNRSVFDRLEAELRVRGVTLLLLPAHSQSVLSGTEDSLSGFFSRPLAPPRRPHGYVRVHLDSIYASTSIKPMPEPATSRAAIHQSFGTTITSSLSLSELSIFAFLSTPGSSELAASPLLITDPNLPLQYSTLHARPDLRRPQQSAHLPSFELLDWTDPAQQSSSAKPSFWRAKVPQTSKLNDAAHSTSPRHNSAGASSSTPLGRLREEVARPEKAVSVKFTMMNRYRDVRSSRSKGKAPMRSVHLQVDVAPLHVFCDVALALGTSPSTSATEALAFMGELTSSDVDGSEPQEDPWEDEEDSDEEEEDTPPATPRATSPYTTRRSERDQERERKRLERMVLEDLDLGYDYRQTTAEPISRNPSSRSRVHDWQKKRKRPRKTHQTTISITVPTIRVEARASPHLPAVRRSGALILDIHDLRIHPGDPPPVKHTARFATQDEDFDTERLPVIRQDVEAALLFGECERVVFAYSPAGESRANVFFSLGSDAIEEEPKAFSRGWSGSPRSPPPPVAHPTVRLRPQFTVSRSTSKPSPTASELTTLTVTLDVPSIYVRLCKPALDGLQLWADDLSLMIERCLGSSSPETEGNGSKNPSLIGSRFFAKTRRSQDSGTDSASVVSAQRTTASTETIVKLLVADVAVRLDMPRQTGEDAQTRPFDVLASNVDVLFEVNPEGKDQTVVTVGVTDLDVVEHGKDHSPLKFLGLTQPHSEISAIQPLLKLRFVSLILPETSAKESRAKVTLRGVTYTLYPDLDWISEIGQFFKAPPGVFESVVPSERTRVSVKVLDSSVRVLAATNPGSLVLHIGELDFNTVLVGNLPEMSLHILAQTTSLFLIDDISTLDDESSSEQAVRRVRNSRGGYWKALGYALVMELDGFDFRFIKKFHVDPPDIQITVNGADLRLHLCADTGSALGAVIGALTAMFSSPSDAGSEAQKTRQPTEVASPPPRKSLLASIDEHAFLQQIPQVGPAPDLIYDDLPSNADYLDAAFGAAGGLLALDDDEDEFGEYNVLQDQPGTIATYGGETIRLLDPSGLHIVENYFDTLQPDSIDEGSQYGETTLKVRLHDCNATVFLYDGYDWQRTRRIIEEKRKEVRRRLAKIRQLVASGQTPDPSVEETNTLLFNSVYIGLEHNVDELEPGALIAAIDEELNEDLETASQSSWQSLKPQQLSPTSSPAKPASKRPSKRLSRSRGPCIDFRLQHLDADIANYRSHPSVASRTLVTVRDVEILDHIRTSTWSKFLTSLATDSKGNIRETGSNMVRVELQQVYPVPGNPTEEARLKAKILPLRLYVDQDALDFMKRFFSFSDSEGDPEPSEPQDEIFFQQVEVFPVDIKLDYKPRRVDYRALRAGRTIELMNFFHFDGAEMTLRHITLTGITGWARVGDLLNDLWTPDVKATQLVDVISGVAPIRSVVNVGSGVADLVLLPIAQYRKDGRLIRGLQKGTTAFVQSTAVEAIKLGARLATGTQVILERAEHVIGGEFTDPVTAEAVLPATGIAEFGESQGESSESAELISRYAEQPMNVKEGVKSAVRSLKRNFNSAAQTILAVPMEVYERSGNEGAVRAVVRAVPIAVLKPMIGASEAVSKTLMGIHNSLDPSVRAENEAKYKHR